MNVFVMPSYDIEQMIDNIEGGFGWGPPSETDDKIKESILAMELALDINPPTGLRWRVMRIKENEFMDEAIKNNQAEKHKVIHKHDRWFKIFFVLAVLSGIIGIVMSNIDSSNNIVRIIGAGFFLLVYVFLLCVAITVIKKNILKKRAGKDTATAEEYNNKISAFNPWELLSICDKASYTSLNYDNDLTAICEHLGLSVHDMKEYVGRQKGGGSTWVGWGGVGAIGLGIGLSAVSKLNAARKNSKINNRAEEIEAYCFYNNVASYFNSLEVETPIGIDTNVQKMLT